MGQIINFPSSSANTSGIISLDNLEQIIDDINRVSTNGNLTDSTSLLEIIEAFKLAYRKFIEEYNELDKLDLGDETEISEYSPYEDNNGLFRYLMIEISNPKIISKPSTCLCMKETDGVVEAYIKNSDTGKHQGESYYRQSVSIKESAVKDWLDLFDKYSALFDFYNWIKEAPLCEGVASDGTSFVIISYNDSEFNDILSNEQVFKFDLGLRGIKITYDLNSDTGNISVEMLGKKIQNQNTIDRLLDGISIHNDYLNHTIFINRKNQLSFDRLKELVGRLKQEEIARSGK